MPLFGKKKETALVTYISDSGVESRIDVPIGDSVMEGAIKNGVDGIVAECGGACMCGTCHVYVDEAWLDKLVPVAEDEDAMLDTTACPRRPNSRLSCQIPVKKEIGGFIVRMPATQV